MQLTGKQIIERGILSNTIEKGIQQQGVDVRLDSCRKVKYHMELRTNTNQSQYAETLDPGMTDFRLKVDWIKTGIIPVEGKTSLPESFEIEPDEIDGKLYYSLEPGYYEITFMEGCKIPADCTMYFKSRSSLVRCGGDVRSGQFDGGFETKQMGAFLKVDIPLIIEKGARIAQTIIHESYPVADEDLYNGQWQNDKQRK